MQPHTLANAISPGEREKGDVRLAPAQVIVPDIRGMSEPPISYKRHRFPPQTIAHAVRCESAPVIGPWLAGHTTG